LKKEHVSFFQAVSLDNASKTTNKEKKIKH